MSMPTSDPAQIFPQTIGKTYHVPCGLSMFVYVFAMSQVLRKILGIKYAFLFMSLSKFALSLVLYKYIKKEAYLLLVKISREKHTVCLCLDLYPHGVLLFCWLSSFLHPSLCASYLFLLTIELQVYFDPLLVLS